MGPAKPVPTDDGSWHSGSVPIRPIQKLLCANRGEIAIRVFRAASELGIRTVAIYSHQDRVHLHRYKADEAYLVGKGKSAVGAYLAIDEILDIAQNAGVDAIHPGYGFLSENADFRAACRERNIRFIGPSENAIRICGDKTAARTLAKKIGVSVVPGSDGPIASVEEAKSFTESIGLPVILKAAMGGGGRGMRIVRNANELEESFVRCQSEALNAFGNGTLFIERLVEHPKHIEVQVLGDSAGAHVHLFERDCSVQRRHQKVVELAPAQNLPDTTRGALYRDALTFAKAVNYENAGTVEFLVDREGRHYFIEVNPRLQVEHTVTEEVTGVDIVQTQIKIAEGHRLEDLGLSQDLLSIRGVAIQCRVTTEDPRKNFQPDTGRIEAFRAGEGMGIRLDGGSGYAGAQISPDYDSLLVKVTGRARSFKTAVAKLTRSLLEFRVRGVTTNVPFLLKVLNHKDFLESQTYTQWVDETKDLFEFPHRKNRGQRFLKFFAEMVVNGPELVGMGASPPSRIEPPLPEGDFFKSPFERSLTINGQAYLGWKEFLDEKGPAEFAKAVRNHQGVLITDTTWRDAHQSLLATRLRTTDILKIAPQTARALAHAYSIECWGGATFDVALRFLKECPWERLDRMRELVPNVPFQMLFRGANAVGYTGYPDNAVHAFAKMAKEHGVDVFRVFDSLNYIENLKLGIHAVGEAGGVIEAAICYSGDVSDETRTKYPLSYYIDLAGQLNGQNIHVLCIKDMAGLLKPRAAKLLISELRKAFPDLPIHVHTHDTAGTGVASMLEAVHAGADAIDLALPAMAGTTSQPTMSAIVSGLRGTDKDTGIKEEHIRELNHYWEFARGLYAPFETGVYGYAPDLYEHEIPGGQYTNLLFQATQNGLAHRWSAIKRAYREANLVLGDIIKVTPSSKVVGDLAQFMVQNDLDGKTLVEKAGELSLPSSVLELLEGRLGQPKDGFPEPFRTRALRGRKVVEGRPGASLPPLDFDQLRADLEAEHGPIIRDFDVMSAAMYPEVFREYRVHRTERGDVSRVPTRYFFAKMDRGDEVSFDIEQGKTLVITFRAVGELDDDGNRQAFFELNGQPRSMSVRDKSQQPKTKPKEKADPTNLGSVAAPMPGSVVDLRVKVGDSVEKGSALVVLSAMKMETVVNSPVAGKISRIAIAAKDVLKAGDLLVEIA